MGMIDRLRSMFIPPVGPGIDNWYPFVGFNGNTYPITLSQTLQGREERPDPGYVGLVQWAYQTNAVVYACVQVRAQLFSEARFAYRRWSNGYPGDLFTDATLRMLEVPWPNGTTGDLLTRMLLDADLSGDAFVLRTSGGLFRMRPDWVTVITDLDAWEPNAKVMGYAYQPGGPAAGQRPLLYQVEQVAHFAPSPDPLSPHRGMPWLTPVIREIAADIGMTEHKRAFLVNGATPNLVVSLDPAISKDAFDKWVEAFRTGHEGARNAYRTMYLGGGAKADVVGKDLQQLDFKLVQGAGETRIAAAAGVPPVIVGLSEGLQAATYSNYSQARRRFADGTMRPLWRQACGALDTIVNGPTGAELWYQDRDVAFLQDDMKDRAEILKSHMLTMESGVRSGLRSGLDVVTADHERRPHEARPHRPLLGPAPAAHAGWAGAGTDHAGA